MMKENKTDLNPAQKEKSKHLVRLLAGWLMILFVTFAYVGSEWLFMITKPSSMSQTTLIEKMTIPFFSIALLTLLACLIQTVLYFLVHKKFDSNHWGSRLMMIIPAFIMASTILLFVDNLTYITMSIGIITSRRFVRLYYAMGFLLLAGFFVFDFGRLHKALIENLSRRTKEKNKRLFATVMGLMVIIVITGFVLGLMQKPHNALEISGVQDKKNVVLITADGLETKYMSVYGYEKDTTPFLKSGASRALIAANHFSNSGNTGGSVTSILTGKYPTKTRVLYRPDILRGEDSYQSLPAVLKQSGYYCGQYSYEYYADAIELNFKEAFDYVNGRGANTTRLFGFRKLPLPTNYEYFLYELQTRLIPRLKHIFLVNIMQNQFQQMTGQIESSDAFKDQQKISWATEILLDTERPVFLHIHWMGTHGPDFKPLNRVFSADLDINQQADWDISFYEDAILDFDDAIRRLYTELENAGILNDTLIIIGSDHAMQFVTDKPIPLILLIPEADYTGEILIDTQNIDIAPTILDYLGAEIPEWMAGESLLAPIDKYRALISVRLKHSDGDGEALTIDNEYNNPPFYQFDLMAVQNCGRYIELDLETYEWNIRPVPGYVSACSSDDIIDIDTVYQLMIDRLKKDGFEFNETDIPKPQEN